MKKRLTTIAMIVSLAFFALIHGFAFPPVVLAWDNCPRGMVNDPYPGACSRYEDTNGDGICDLSQSEPTPSTTTTSLTTTTTKETSTTTTSPVAAVTTSGEPPTGDCPLGPCIGCGACLGISGEALVASADTGDPVDAADTAALVATAGSATTPSTIPPSGGSGDSGSSDDSDGSSLLTRYLVSPIAAGFFLIYAASFFLYKTKRMRVATHRKIWNVLLLATFLITGVFGLVLVVQLDYKLPFTMPIDLLFWHVEAGIVMTLISLFHIGWHFNYYRKLLRTGRAKAREARAAERARALEDPQLVWEAREKRRADREAARAGREAGRTVAGSPEVQPVFVPRSRY